MMVIRRIVCILIIIMTGAVCAGCSGKGQGAHVDEGMAALQELDYDLALTKFEEALLSGESKRLIYRGQGLAYMGKTMYEEAAASLEKSLSYSSGIIDRMDYDVNYYLAAANYKQGKFDEAIESYNAILALDSSQADAFYLRGVILAEKGQMEEARKDFDKVRELDPRNYDRLIDIYSVLEMNGYKEVGKEYLQAVADSEFKGMKDYEIGRIYYFMEDYNNARNYLEKARETGGAQAVLFLGKTYETLGDYNYAVSVYNAYIAGDEPSPPVYNQLGICKMSMGEYEEALAAFQAGMNIEGNDMLQILKMNEIVAYEYLGEYKKASVLLEGYLKTYPDDEEAAREHVFLKTR